MADDPFFFTVPRPSSAELEASRLMGTYTYPQDFEITLQSPGVKGNAYVYKTSNDRQPLRCFLLGQICDIEAVYAQREVSPADLVVIHRYKLRVLDHATEKTQIFFSNDVTVLLDVMLQEKPQGGVILHPWAERHVSVIDGQHVDYIYFNCIPSTKVVNGPVVKGCHVVIDVSLHRHDTHLHERLSKVYSIIAHDVEVVHPFFSEEAGLVARRCEIEESEPGELMYEDDEQGEGMEVDR